MRAATSLSFPAFVRKPKIFGICAKGLRLSAIKFNATGLKPTLFSLYPELSRRLSYQ
jgi:hypothetical protein